MQLKAILTTLLLTGVLSGLGTPAPALAQQAEEIDHIVALVDEDIILRSELDTAVLGVVERIRSQGGNLPPQDLLEKQVLERLILRKLQIMRAFRTGIRVSDADIDQAIGTLAQQNGLTVTQMRQVLESDGEDFGEFRRNIGEEIVAERLRQRVVSSMDPISDTEVDIMLASEEFSGGEYHISHIMINLPEGATPRQIEAAAEKINGVHAELEEGLDFASAAISYSESQEALDGGEVGWRDLSSVPRDFADAIRNLRAGQYTVPIRSPAGFHIIRVNDYRDTAKVMAKEHHARHILIEVNELVTPRDAMDQIRDLRERIVAGEEFEAIAREYSDDPTSANIGGDMGWFEASAYGDRIGQILLGLEDGEISEPFQTQVGWHVIQKLGYRETDVSEEVRRNKARNNIMQRKADTEIERFLRQLREEAYVDIRLTT